MQCPAEGRRWCVQVGEGAWGSDQPSEGLRLLLLFQCCPDLPPSLGTWGALQFHERVNLPSTWGTVLPGHWTFKPTSALPAMALQVPSLSGSSEVDQRSTDASESLVTCPLHPVDSVHSDFQIVLEPVICCCALSGCLLPWASICFTPLLSLHWDLGRK